MFSHVFVGVNHFEQALDFYNAVLSELGIQQRFCERTRPWAGWQSVGQVRPLFLIGSPYDGELARVGNGAMVAFSAPTRQCVDKAYATALQHGGLSEGAPGLRPAYHADYYGAYFRDPEGNKIGVVCHAQSSAD